jgi:hypothetical protein
MSYQRLVWRFPGFDELYADSRDPKTKRPEPRGMLPASQRGLHNATLRAVFGGHAESAYTACYDKIKSPYGWASDDEMDNAVQTACAWGERPENKARISRARTHTFIVRGVTWALEDSRRHDGTMARDGDGHYYTPEVELRRNPATPNRLRHDDDTDDDYGTETPVMWAPSAALSDDPVLELVSADEPGRLLAAAMPVLAELLSSKDPAHRAYLWKMTEKGAVFADSNSFSARDSFTPTDIALADEYGVTKVTIPRWIERVDAEVRQKLKAAGVEPPAIRERGPRLRSGLAGHSGRAWPGGYYGDTFGFSVLAGVMVTDALMAEFQETVWLGAYRC